LRGLAVAAVVAFHFAPAALPGGFLGVDLFFVISGYLITRMLLAEIDATGRICVRDFYARRARRLLPAVITMLLVTTTADALVWRDELPAMRGGVLAALGYVTNWWLIGDHQSYFVATGRPPMVQHLWSLAIEEQFYLVWPLVLAVIAGAYLTWRSRGTGATGVLASGRLYRVAGVAAGLAIASTLAMAVIAVGSDVPYGADSGRVYFGTDTHAMGLLLGAAAGALAVRGPLPFTRRRLLRGAFLTDVAAALALFALVRIVTGVDEFTPWLYRGGFLAVSSLGLVVVVAAPRPTSLVGWLLDRPPLRWLGQRSYSIYLWHWPAAVVTRPDVDLSLAGWRLFALRAAITLGLAAANYRFVERPFRIGGLRGVVHASGWPRLPQTVRAWVTPAAGAGAVIVAASLISVFAYTAPHSALAATLLTPARSAPASTSAIHRPVSARPAPDAKRRPIRVPGRPSPVRSPTVSAFGDSVMLGAAPELTAAVAHLSVSAVEGRQARDVFADVARRRAAGTLGSCVVIHAGDNGIISPYDLSSTLVSLSDRQRVVVLTDRVPRDWQGPNNEIVRGTVGRFRNAVLLDWYEMSNHHKDWFYADGLHLQPVGARAYAVAVAAAVKG
jgi:peptidoglycan/LPS O-acetylase OafA/YrhL